MQRWALWWEKEKKAEEERWISGIDRRLIRGNDKRCKTLRGSGFDQASHVVSQVYMPHMASRTVRDRLTRERGRNKNITRQGSPFCNCKELSHDRLSACICARRIRSRNDPRSKPSRKGDFHLRAGNKTGVC